MEPSGRNRQPADPQPMATHGDWTGENRPFHPTEVLVAKGRLPIRTFDNRSYHHRLYTHRGKGWR
jgi:hypothetical protein